MWPLVPARPQYQHVYLLMTGCCHYAILTNECISDCLCHSWILSLCDIKIYGKWRKSSACHYAQQQLTSKLEVWRNIHYTASLNSLISKKKLYMQSIPAIDVKFARHICINTTVIYVAPMTHNAWDCGFDISSSENANICKTSWHRAA